jgi:hypothetical protein
MSVRAPNYLYPLESDRKLQWTKQAVRGEDTVKKPINIKASNAPKKEAIQMLVKKSKLPAFGKPQKTRNFIRATNRNMPSDPMKAPDPTPGNAMHITNSKSVYNNGYQV